MAPDDEEASGRRPSRRSPLAVAGVALLVLGLVVVVAAVVLDRGGSGSGTAKGPGGCVGPVGSGTVSPQGHVSPPPAMPAGTRYGAGRTPRCGFGEGVLRVTAPSGATAELCVLTATTEAQQHFGLMTVRDRSLGGYDGMAFAFPTEQAGGFYMRDTPLPLSIAYVGANGAVVDAYDMAPCGDRADCRVYGVAEPFRLAVEVPAGRLPALGLQPGAGVALDASATCPARSGS